MKRLPSILVPALLMILSGPVHANILDSFFDNVRLQENSTERILRSCQVEPGIVVDIRIPGPEQVRDKPRGYESFHTDSHGQQGVAYIKGGFDVSFVYEHIRLGQNPGCVRIKSMEIKAGYEAPQIWLHPEIKKGSCEYGVVVEHELQHVKHFQDHLRQFRTSVLHELPILIRRRGYSSVDGAGAGAARKRLETEAMRIIDSLHDRSWTIAENLDAALDTPAEYWRLSNLCR